MSTREQVISARRIVFRRSLKNSHDKSMEQPHYAIQQVQVRGSVNNYKHFEAKTDKKSEQQQQLHWSRSKQKETQLENEDFRAYQNGDLNEFFVGNEDRRVSDVCLMNDHFILVKLPPQAGSSQATSEIQCIVNHVEQRPSLQRSRRVQPIESAIVGIQTVKEFEPVSEAPAALRHIQWKHNLEEQREMKKICGKDSPMPKSILNKNVKNNADKIQRSPFQVVEMQKEAALVCLAENESADPALLKRCESPPKPKRPAIRAFQWLINPFCLRFRRRKRPKPKPNIQAVIYKTYFMRWTKPSDVAYTKSFDSQSMRRIRSAIF